MIINLSNKSVTVKEGDTIVTYPAASESEIAYLSDIVGEINGVPIINYEFKVKNLPEPKEGIYYIVSKEVMEASPDRKDLIRPNLSRANRNQFNQITYITCWVSN